MRLAPAVPFSIGRLSIRGGLAGAHDTLGIMRALAREGSRSATVRAAAVNVIFLQTQKDELHEVESIFEFVRDSIRYVRDPWSFESVAMPDQVLALGYGDCDDKATLLAAMLESVGYPTRFVLAGYRDSVPDHVYLQVVIHGQWVDADPSEPRPLGWAPPDPLFLDFERV